jgi:hypothetical protein
MKARTKGMEAIGSPKTDPRTGALAAGHTVEFFVNPVKRATRELAPPAAKRDDIRCIGHCIHDMALLYCLNNSKTMESVASSMIGSIHFIAIFRVFSSLLYLAL